MDLRLKNEIKNLVKKYNLLPKKSLGQNFLISQQILKKIIKASSIQKNDIVLEVGPGLGTLTKELSQKAKKVIAIEKDEKMFEILREELRDYKNVEFIQRDILKIKIDELKLKSKKYKITANLPYYIATPVLRKFLELKNHPNSMILMVQKQVAQRICAKPPNMNLLAVFVQFYAQTKIIGFVSKKSFFPEPKVDGAIIRINPNNKFPSIIGKLENLFFEIVKIGFSKPRKQILNIFFNSSLFKKQSKENIEKWLLKNKINPKQRAESLTINNWIDLSKTYQNI
ncbi:MAG: 16S rRNA (adenine(1518)-N(6)/adenine(1519)-N(6))-dimethyltransferase RsmA [Patescibacteria group bacterium]|nr:16S rRNA (adenine(1518)-N(6)/adenine(1519)-N(6))-dimethyltransferase RsmA [Patescibacteria group bacterium]